VNDEEVDLFVDSYRVLAKKGVRNFAVRFIKFLFLFRIIRIAWMWKQSVTVPIYMRDYKTNSSNYRCISQLPDTYRNLPNILLSRLTSYAEELFGGHYCGIRCNRSTSEHIKYIRQILEEKGNNLKQRIRLLHISRKLMNRVVERTYIIFPFSFVSTWNW